MHRSSYGGKEVEIAVKHLLLQHALVLAPSRLVLLSMKSQVVSNAVAQIRGESCVRRSRHGSHDLFIRGEIRINAPSSNKRECYTKTRNFKEPPL